MKTFRIDNRECEEVFQEFQRLQTKLMSKKDSEEIEIVRESLLAGDVVCGNVCFERKEGGDFVSSLIDHRFKKQCHQMSLNFQEKYVVFVGDVFDVQSSISKLALVGAQASAIIRHNIHFIHVQNNEQFAWACWTVINKLADGKVFNPEEHQIVKFDVSSKDKFVSMLTASGIGVERARMIAQKCDYRIVTLLEHIDELMELDGVGLKSVMKLKEVLGLKV